MHWHFHMMAIVLAGGSVAACSEGSEVDTSGASQQQRESTTAGASASAPGSLVEGLSPLVRALPQRAAPSMGYRIPPCNANPDPCCRNPDLPGCQVDAGADVPDAATDAAEAGSPDACPSQSSD
jgi:hypothetical protein